MVQSISACCISKLLLEAKMHGMSKRRRERERERERERAKNGTNWEEKEEWAVPQTLE